MWKHSMFLVAMILFITLSGTVMAQIDPATVTTGHVYLFDNVSGGIVPDDSANNNAGTLFGNPTVVAGLKGNALQFDGLIDGVNIPDSAYINVTNGPFPNRTVMAVFKCDDVTKQEKQTIIDEGGRTRGLVIYVFNGEVYVGGWNRGEYNWNPGSWISAPIHSNEWHTVALVLRDGHEALEADKFEMWLDGELVGKDVGGHLHNHSDNNAIGYTQQNTVFHDNDGSGDGWFFGGTIDEVWILNTALTEKVLRAFSGKLWPYASEPTPADGAILESTWANLSWTPGDLAVSHDVYFGTNFDDVNDGAEASFVGNTSSTFQVVGFPGFPVPDGLQPGTTYYWRVDEINNNDPDSPWKGEIWSFLVPPLTAYNADPPDGMKFVDPDPTLSWSKGYEAKLHHVYMGDNAADVEAGGATYKGPATTTTFSPGTLEFDKTYYWRIDEFDGINTHKGDIWAFTILPEIVAHEDPNFIAWWKFDEGIGKRALDWSGHDNHVILVDPIWTEPGRYGNAAINLHGRYGAIQNLRYAASDLTEVTVCAWILTTTGSDQYIISFDRDNYYRLEINGNGAGTGQVGWDVMTDSGQVDYGSVSRVDDGQWHHVAGVFDNGFMVIYIDGVPEPSTTGGRTFGSGNTRYGFIGANSEATAFDGTRGGGSPVTGELDDVRIYDRSLTQIDIFQVMRGDPLFAWAPSPADESETGINVANMLSWSAGEGASEHDVYFGTDQAAIIDADTSDTTGLYKGRQSATSYAPEGITENSGPYYWRIDEVASNGSVVKGSVWSFSVADYSLVEDFESYNDIPADEPGSNLVYMAWVDGFDDPSVNGSTMGYITGQSLETGNVRSGDKSVPFQYNNATVGISEVVRTFTPAQDWTAYGAKTLSFWFAGHGTNVPGQLYMKVNGVRVNYDGLSSTLALAGWQPWNIDLASIGTNLTSVTSMAIGIQGSGANGTLLLDDIRLYPYPEESVTPVQPDATGLVLHYAFDGNANDSTGANPGTAFGGATYGSGKIGQAINLDGVDDYVAIGNLHYASGGHTAVTVCAWVRTTSGADQIIASFDRNEYWRLEINGDGAGPGQVGWDVMTDTGQVDYSSDARVDDGQWHHIAGTFDNGTLTIYVDGNAHKPASGGLTYGTGNTRYGYVGLGSESTDFNADPRTPASFVSGAIDDVRIYERALTHGEIAGLAGRVNLLDKPFK
ncbi:MAG: hypothetical protein JXM79_01225 [Sedimentisphaerales bacterium]|nr:hypothetical protein [Sedimentisphaerales bacterium]